MIVLTLDACLLFGSGSRFCSLLCFTLSCFLCFLALTLSLFLFGLGVEQFTD